MSNRKLLLADDSVTIQKVINLTFADEGIEVMTVGDGDTAMERFYDFRPDIVLADVNMPGLNGYRICENLRQREDTANVPVILLVGFFEPFDEDEARRVGASDWITKPFQSIRQLVTKVSDLLDNPRAMVNGETPAIHSSQEDLPVAPQDHFQTAENEDIDSLYRQSIAETVELPRSFRPDPVLGDAGMDDDMIEMSYSGAAAEEPGAKEFEFISPIEPENFERPTFDEQTVPDISEPADETSPDEAENFAETLPAIDFRPADVDERPEISFRFEEPEQPPQEESVTETTQESAIPETTEEGGFEFQPEPEPEIALDTEPLSYETRPDIGPDIGDINLLEIPASGPGPPAEYRSDENILPLDAPAGSDDLSPDFIDAVARKVIEKISENVIRQIAWQVVPQVAESVMREKTRGGSDQ